MGKYTSIARHLTLIAKRLLEAGKKERFNEYTSILKKERFNQNEINEILEKLDGLQPAKKERVALHWLMNDTLKLPKDAKKLDEAFITLEKHHKRFENYETPDEIIDFGRKRKIEKTKTDDFNPNTCPEFSNKQNLGNGIVVYDVKNTWEGMMAIRTAMDTSWGYDEGKWCLATRDHGKMDRAWKYWNHYNAYQKRIAFKNGKVYMFCANDDDKLAWWNKDDKKYDYLPDAFDERGYELIGNKGIAKDPGITAKDLKILANNINENVRQGVARNPNTPVETLKILANDRNEHVRYNVVENPKTPAEVLKMLANDENEWVRWNVAKNPNTPAEALKLLADDEDEDIRSGVAGNPNTPVKSLIKLSGDKESFIRRDVARSSKIPTEILKKLADDKDKYVRENVAANPETPVETLIKLSEDNNFEVRGGVARNFKTPNKVLMKLSEDKYLEVRRDVSENPNTPIEALTKLAKDEYWVVRKNVKNHLGF